MAVMMAAPMAQVMIQPRLDLGNLHANLVCVPLFLPTARF